ncbi:MAG TPA: class I SAM-dependent methyltransferase [Patescibacteria group bacterium]|nr:class I SAM-dependent methyltransferase [Patescibacteria group bacterium]
MTQIHPRHIVKEGYNKIGAKYLVDHFKVPQLKEIFQLFCAKLPAGAHVLDAGSGTGIPVARELVQGGYHVTGVDISETMVERARMNVPQGRFIEQSVTDMLFEEEYEGVVSFYTFVHLPNSDIIPALEKIKSALKPNGFFLLVTNVGGHEVVEEFFGEPMYFSAYNLYQTRNFLKATGFVILNEKEIQKSSKTFGKEDTVAILSQKK